MRLSLMVCAAAALALLVVKDASAQSGVPNSYQRGRAGPTSIGAPRPTATRPSTARRMRGPTLPQRMGSSALTRLAFRAAFHTRRGRQLTAPALRQYRGRGEPTFWSAAYPNEKPFPRVHIYLSNPDHVKAATVEVKPRGVCVNGRCVMPGPNQRLGSRTGMGGKKQAPASLSRSVW